MAGEGYTHYYWEDHPRLVVGLLTGAFPISCNTYTDHPTGHGRDGSSIDCWSPAGRGYPIDPAVGQQIVDYCFSDSSPLLLDWLIWQGYIWSRGGGWQEYWDVSDLHYDHVHMTLA